MKTNIIAVYDRVIKQYGPLMNPRNIERVQEEFDALCKDEKTQYSKNPQDYEVHLLGQFNDSPDHDPEVKNILISPKVIAIGRPHANS